MSEERTTPEGQTEEGFFAGRPAAPAPSAPPARRRESPLLARSPLVAVVVGVLAGWLLHSLWPDVAYFASPRVPIDLGGSGAYRLDAARENRLVQIRGELVQGVTISEGRTGATRTVGRVSGTNLLVDRPGRAGPPVFEGRLLPRSRRDAYDEVAQLVRKGGAPLGEGWQVLRDGERPRTQWWSLLGAALLVVVLAVNVRALLRPIFTRSREPR